MLATEQHAVVHRKPCAAYHSSVQPPVGNFAVGSRLQVVAGDGVDLQFIVDFNCENIIRLQRITDVDGILAITAFVLAHKLAVQPHPRLVERCSEMHLDMLSLPGGGGGELPEIPAGAKEVWALPPYSRYGANQLARGRAEVAGTIPVARQFWKGQWGNANLS